MTASPETLHELRASRPQAPPALRASVETLTPSDAPRRAALPRIRVPGRRFGLVALPVAAALAMAAAAVVGLAGSGGSRVAITRGQLDTATSETAHGGGGVSKAPPGTRAAPATTPSLGAVPAPGTNRAQRVTATLTVEVPDSDGVSQAAQDALDLTRSLGGYVVSAA